jgi:hypothetical protein
MSNSRKLRRAQRVSRQQPVRFGPVNDGSILCRGQGCMAEAVTAVILPAGMLGPDSPETMIAHCADHQDDAMAAVAQMLGIT